MSRYNCFVDPSASIDPTSVVWHFARVLADVTIGDHVSIGGGAEIGRGSTINHNSRISANVFLPANSRIGAYVFVGPGVVFTDDKFPKALAPGETYFAQPPVIEDHASIGAGAVILPGVRIGAHALIAAGAIVTRDVAAHEMIRGEPARSRERSDASTS